MNIDRAASIQGWMSEAELTWLAEQAAKHKVIVEIGAFLGRSTRALADNTPGIVYAIDDWYGPRDVGMSDEDRAKIFNCFMKNMDGLQGRLHVVTSDHATATIDQAPDMVFIDGDHNYKSVARDIERWKRFIAPGGLLCGHDGYLPGVLWAIRDTIGDDFHYADDTSIWWYETSAHPFGKHLGSSPAPGATLNNHE